MATQNVTRWTLEGSVLVEKGSSVSSLCYGCNNREICAITSSRADVFDCEKLVSKARLQAKPGSKPWSDVKVLPNSRVMISSFDGNLRIWDTRDPAGSVLIMRTALDNEGTSTKPLLCCDASSDGVLACAGSEAIQEDAFVLFWDIRSSHNLLGGYWEGHSEDVTQVRFHQQHDALLSTGGMDGLVNVFDVNEACEDDALQYTMNAECAVNHIAWLNASSERANRIGVVTTGETFQIWEPDGVGSVSSMSRNLFATDEAKKFSDHILGVFLTSDDQPVILCSSNQGALSLWSVKGALLTELVASHWDLVRSFAVSLESHLRLLWTSGDDGLLCFWRQNSESELSQNE